MSLKILCNHAGARAASFGLVTGAVAAGATTNLISGPRSTFCRSSPTAALTNLLENGSDFSQASWNKDNTSASATTITASAGNSRHNVRQSDASVVAGQLYQFIVDVKKTNHQYLWIGEGGDAQWHGGVLDLDTGTITGNGFTNAITAVLLSDGYYRVRVQWTRTNGGGTQELYVALQSTLNPAAPETWTAAGTETVLARSAFFSPFSTPSVFPAYNFSSDISCDYLVIARADWMATLGGARVVPFQKDSVGAWSEITGGAVDHVSAGSLVGPGAQDLVINTSGAIYFRGIGFQFQSFLTGSEAMMCSKLYGCVSLDLGSPEQKTPPVWQDIPDKTQRMFTPPMASWPYETERKTSITFPLLSAATAQAFKALPFLLRWPCFLYDSSGDVFPWKLEHVIVEGWEEDIQEKDRHTLTVSFRRLAHYP